MNTRNFNDKQQWVKQKTTTTTSYSSGSMNDENVNKYKFSNFHKQKAMMFLFFFTGGTIFGSITMMTFFSVLFCFVPYSSTELISKFFFFISPFFSQFFIKTKSVCFDRIKLFFCRNRKKLCLSTFLFHFVFSVCLFVLNDHFVLTETPII